MFAPADDGERDGPKRRAEALVRQESRQVNGDGGDVEAADEKPGRQEQKAWIPQGLGKRAS